MGFSFLKTPDKVAMNNLKINDMDDFSLPVCIYDFRNNHITGNSLFMSQFGHDDSDLMKTLQDMVLNKRPLNVFEHDSNVYVVLRIFCSGDADMFLFAFEEISKGHPCASCNRIAQTKEDYLSIISLLHDDFTIVDNHGILTTVLPNFESFYGFPATSVVGKSVFDLEKEHIFNPSISAKVLRSHKAETRLQITKSGKHLICTAIPQWDSNGNLKRIVSYSRDITGYGELAKQHSTLTKAIHDYSLAINPLEPATDMTSNARIIYRSHCIAQLLETVHKLACFDVNILLTGETGVGKTQFAKEIHLTSNRSAKPFIELNCMAIPDQLFESELFGYEGGAFTGAKDQGKVGWIEEANGGTLFLDEITGMPMSTQGKLLKVLDTKKVVHVGGTKEIPVDFRLIAATNESIVELVKKKKFREDLFYRINVVSMGIPPLRKRTDDIPPLIDFFTNVFCNKYQINKKFHEDAVSRLQRYHWPGNIRELKNVVERILITSSNAVITDSDLQNDIVLSPMKTSYEEAYSIPDGLTLPMFLANIEKKIILDTYEKTKSTVETAKKLGIAQPTVSTKLKKYQNEGHELEE